MRSTGRIPALAPRGPGSEPSFKNVSSYASLFFLNDFKHRPLMALQMQSELAILLADPLEGDVTSQTLINTGTTDIP